MIGDKRSTAHVAEAAAERGFAAFNVNYTLATPENPGFPRQLTELRAAVRWIRANAAQLNVDPDRIGALGASAGGHLVALLALGSDGPLEEGSRIRAAVTWSAPTKLDSLRGWLGLAVQNLVGCLQLECPRREDAASPVTHVSPDDAPMMIVNGRREIVAASQARLLARRLGWIGVPHRLRIVPGADHGREHAAAALRPSFRFLVRQLTR